MSIKQQKGKSEKIKKCARSNTCALKIRGTAPCLKGRCQRYKKFGNRKG